MPSNGALAVPGLLTAILWPMLKSSDNLHFAEERKKMFRIFLVVNFLSLKLWWSSQSHTLTSGIRCWRWYRPMWSHYWRNWLPIAVDRSLSNWLLCLHCFWQWVVRPRFVYRDAVCLAAIGSWPASTDWCWSEWSCWFWKEEKMQNYLKKVSLGNELFYHIILSSLSYQLESIPDRC